MALVGRGKKEGSLCVDKDTRWICAFYAFFPLYCILIFFEICIIMLMWCCFFECHFLIVQYGFDQNANWPILMCQNCSCVCFNANMNYVHCIDDNNENVGDDDDIVMYLNFWSMFCKPLLYRLYIQCHDTCYCCCFLCVSCTRLLIKSS